MTDGIRTNDRTDARVGRKMTSAIMAERAKLKDNEQSVEAHFPKSTYAVRRAARSSLARRSPILCA